MTHTPDQIRRAALARDAYLAAPGGRCVCCNMPVLWLAVGEAIEADVLAQQGAEQGGKWVKCDDVPAHEHPAGTRWRETRIAGGAWEGREHWEPATPPDPDAALVEHMAQHLASDGGDLVDDTYRDIARAHLDALREVAEVTAR